MHEGDRGNRLPWIADITGRNKYDLTLQWRVQTDDHEVWRQGTEWKLTTLCFERMTSVIEVVNWNDNGTEREGTHRLPLKVWRGLQERARSGWASAIKYTKRPPGNKRNSDRTRNAKKRGRSSNVISWKGGEDLGELDGRLVVVRQEDMASLEQAEDTVWMMGKRGDDAIVYLPGPKTRDMTTRAPGAPNATVVLERPTRRGRAPHLRIVAAGPGWATSNLAIEIPEPLLGHHTEETWTPAGKKRRTTPKGWDASETAARRVTGHKTKRRKEFHQGDDPPRNAPTSVLRIHKNETYLWKGEGKTNWRAKVTCSKNKQNLLVCFPDWKGVTKEWTLPATELEEAEYVGTTNAQGNWTGQDIRNLIEATIRQNNGRAVQLRRIVGSYPTLRGQGPSELELLVLRQALQMDWPGPEGRAQQLTNYINVWEVNPSGVLSLTMAKENPTDGRTGNAPGVNIVVGGDTKLLATTTGVAVRVWETYHAAWPAATDRALTAQGHGKLVIVPAHTLYDAVAWQFNQLEVLIPDQVLAIATEKVAMRGLNHYT